MTREEAIDLLDNLLGMVDDNHDSDYDTALQMAIKALSQEPSGDAISRQDAYKCLEIHGDYNTLNEVYERLEKLPSVNPQEPKTGHWIEEDVFDGDIAYRCSECNELFWLEDGTPKDNEYNFCPKCGANLVEPQESEEV